MPKALVNEALIPVITAGEKKHRELFEFVSSILEILAPLTERFAIGASNFASSGAGGLGGPCSLCPPHTAVRRTQRQLRR